MNEFVPVAAVYDRRRNFVRGTQPAVMDRRYRKINRKQDHV
jgi:hypothetical protein